MAFVLVGRRRRRVAKQPEQPQPTPPAQQPQQQQPQPQPQPPQQQQPQPTPPAQPLASSRRIKVYSVRYDHTTRTLTIDVETDRQEYVSVTGWYKVYDDDRLTKERWRHGAIFWVGYVEGRRTITIRNVPATYIDHSVSVSVRGEPYPSDEYFSTVDEVSVDSSKIGGLSDYYRHRAEALSRARWKYERAIPLGFGFARGGYVAVYSVSVDQNTRTVTVDIEVDGSTRRGDIMSVWFGTASGMRWSVGIGRNRATMNWSDIWNDLLRSGLYIYIRDIEGRIVDQIVIRPEELGITTRTTTG